MTQIKRAVSVDQLLKKKFVDIPLSQRFKDAFGDPDCSGVWMFYGDSGHGKTSFNLQLAKELAKTYKVVYDTLEEGARKSFQRSIRIFNMQTVSRNFSILDVEHIDDLKERLRKHKSPKVIFIDSLQYAGLNRKSYRALKEEFAHKKLFIFISHAKGKKPDGDFARFVQYDADIYGFIEGYRMFPTGRFGGGKPYDIWAEKAAIYHNDITP